MEDTVQPRRYAKACDACHKKKIRCVYGDGICELCQKSGSQCKFTRIEKSVPKRARRGKYLSALEERMKNMEALLKQSQRDKVGSDEIDEIDELQMSETSLTRIHSQASEGQDFFNDGPSKSKDFQLPPKEQAMRLAQGYFASCNHTFPVLDSGIFMQRMLVEYPPERHSDWWAPVVTVLCCAHRLRAMSNPSESEAENLEASRYLKEALEIAPKLTYGKPSVSSIQVLLGIAAILRGTAMPDPAPMLVSAAIRMLHDLNVHKEEPLDGTPFSVRKERERIFWIAYILDKDIALQTRKPPVLHEQDIFRPPPMELDADGIGLVRSLDCLSEVNLFAAAQRLSTIQAKVWDRTYAATVDTMSPTAFQAAQRDINPLLAEWKNSLPFEFKSSDLVGRWPKHAIVFIVVLHFRYFHTLVELNRTPPAKDEKNPLQNGDCPIARSLPSYAHSTSRIAVEAARDALDLASLTPRGNFQNVWLFFQFSISAVLTLLVNAIVRPASEDMRPDMKRVDTWLRVIDILATSSERTDLLQKKEFLVHMKVWALHVLQDTFLAGGTAKDMPCLRQLNIVADDETAAQPMQQGPDNLEGVWMPELEHFQPDVFPLDFFPTADWLEDWQNNSVFGSGQY